MASAKSSRSLGDPTSSTRPTTTSKRPSLGERHNSAPSVTRRKHSDAKRTSEPVKSSERSRTSSKTSERDDHSPVVNTLSASPCSTRHRNSSISLAGSLSVRGYENAILLIFHDTDLRQSNDPSDLPTLNFAVIGNSKVGKTSFSRNALDLRRSNATTATTTSASKVSLGGKLYRLQLVEYKPHELNIVDGRIAWPEKLDVGSLSDIAGAFCLYDVTDRSSLEGLAQILQSLHLHGISTCLVPCKVDLPLSDHEVTTAFTGKVQEKFPNISFEEASIKSSDGAKRALLKVLKPVIATLKSLHDTEAPSQESSTLQPFPPRTSSRSESTSTSRSRSGSRNFASLSKSKENLLSEPNIPEVGSENEEIETGTRAPGRKLSSAQSPRKRPLRVETTQSRRRPTITEPQTPISSGEASQSRLVTPSKRSIPMAPATPESFNAEKSQLRESIDGIGYSSYQTFLNMDDDQSTKSEAEETSGSTRKESNSETRSTEGGVAFTELVERLLSLPTSKGDTKFVPSFLCLYRAFATPTKLLAEVISRFVKTEKSEMDNLSKSAELLRYLSVLGTWTASYPGDFEDSATRGMAIEFLKEVEKSKTFAPSAKQVSNNLQVIVPDEDDDWAYTDKPKTTRSRSNTKPKTATFSETSAFIVTKDTVRKLSQRRRPRHDSDDSDSDEYDNEPPVSSPRHSATASSQSSLAKAAAQASSQSANNIQNLENARDQAKRLRIVPHNPLGKTQWHQFMGYPTEDLAWEITRMDWTMYSAIRPRDLVRYVTMPSAQKVRTGQVDYISMMTKHFNHLALFVSGMILLRDKPKHRARMLEKFMDLAWKVRQMNDYHALGAIVAALNGEEIMRLAQTQSLIPEETHKQGLRLKILMSHARSYGAYRMAWDNTSSEKIPFLPRIQEDMTKAAAGNATFVGSSSDIKWSKFELMGNSIVSLQSSQENPYNFPERTARGYDIDKLILETKILNEPEDCADPRAELYERSKMLEPSIHAGDRRNFGWLTRR